MCARAKGNGCLVKRGDVYHARWVVDGQIYTRSTRCVNKKDALKKLDEFVHPYQVTSDIEKLENLQSKINVLEGEANKTPKDKAIRLNLILDVYENDINQSAVTEATDRDYSAKFNKLAKFVKREFAYQVTEKDVDAFMMEVKHSTAICTYNSYLTIMKRVFKVAMAHDTNIRKNPFAHLNPLKDDGEIYRRNLNADEVSKLIEIAYTFGEEEGLLFKLGAYSGMRRSDCMSLRHDEISFEDKMIRKLPMKTKKTKVLYRIPMIPELYDALKAVPIHESGYVFEKIHSYSHWQISELVKNVFKKAGIEIFKRDADGRKHYITGFHAFRHTLASKLHKNGTPINQIKTILAHKKIDMSLHYAHVEEEDLVMPDLTNSIKVVRVKTQLYAKVMSYGTGNDTFDEALEKMIINLQNCERDTEAFIKSEEERKAKEKAELDRLIDDLFDKDGHVSKESMQKSRDRGQESIGINFKRS